MRCVSGRDYVQTETGLDEETFDGRYQVSSSDMEPITWANYKDFLPSDAAPVTLIDNSPAASLVRGLTD